MGKRVFAHLNWTPGATADGSTIAAGFMALKGGSTSQLVRIREVSIQGMAAAAAATPLILAFDSTLGVTPTALATPDSDALVSPGTSTTLSSAPVSYVAAATNPTRSNSTTSPKFTFGINAFGGIFRHNFTPGEELEIFGNSTTTGELSLSCYTGGSPGLIQSHIEYEAM